MSRKRRRERSQSTSAGYITNTATAPKKVEAPAAGLDALREYLIIGQPANPRKPLSYVLTGGGAVEIYRTRLYTSVRKVTDVPGLPSVPEGITLNLPKLPWEILQQTVAFFRAVCVRYKGGTEAIVQIAHHAGEQRYEIRVPKQEVSGARVSHESASNTLEEGWTWVMDIHSHGSMSAFWSGTDDADEKRGNRLYGVIGEVAKPQPTMRFRTWNGSNFIDLTVEQLFDLPAEPVSVPIHMAVLLTGSGTIDVKMLDPFAGDDCPPEWLERTSERSYMSMGRRHGLDDDGSPGGATYEYFMGDWRERRPFAGHESMHQPIRSKQGQPLLIPERAGVPDDTPIIVRMDGKRVRAFKDRLEELPED